MQLKAVNLKYQRQRWVFCNGLSCCGIGVHGDRTDVIFFTHLTQYLSSPSFSKDAFIHHPLSHLLSLLSAATPSSLLLCQVMRSPGKNRGPTQGFGCHGCHSGHARSRRHVGIQADSRVSAEGKGTTCIKMGGNGRSDRREKKERGQSEKWANPLLSPSWFLASSQILLQ